MAFEFSAFIVGSQFCRAFVPDTWPTWALVVVGIGGIIYAARTLGAIRHEAQIAKEIAAAANLNAKAVIDSERAWIVADENPRIADIASGQPITIIWTIRNGGKTTARVTEKAEAYSVQFSLNGLPEQPNYSLPTLWPDGIVLAPNSTLNCAVRVLNPDPWHQIENGSMILFVYGLVKYRDVFEREHETRYIFRYDASKAFSADGKLEYSKAT